MRIGVCGHFLGRGAKARYTRALLEGLVEDDATEVVAIAPSGPVESEGVRTVSLGSGRGSLPRKVLSQLRSVDSVNDADLDVVHCPGEIVPPYFWRVDARKVVTFGGDGLVCGMSLRRRLRFYHRVLTVPHLASLASIYIFRDRLDAVVTVSEMMRGNIADAFRIERDAITPIHHGYDPETFYNAPEDAIKRRLARLQVSTPYVCHVSGYRRVKNVDGIVEGFARFVRNDVDATLAIAGPKSSGFRRIERLAQELDIADRVQFLGHLDDNELRALYTGAEALCQPSYRETFGFPILEALACGTPAIVSDDVGVLENHPESQLRVDPESPDEIAQAIETVVGDERLQTELLTDVEGLLSSHTWKEIWPRYLELYRSLE